MSTLESLVTDLATSQRLKDAGLPQDTAMVWIKTAWGLHVVKNGDPVNRSFTLCAAPTAGELEEWLMTLGFHQLLTSKNPDDPIPERLWMVLASIHPKQIVQHAYGATHVSALAALVLEVAG